MARNRHRRSGRRQDSSPLTREMLPLVTLPRACKGLRQALTENTATGHGIKKAPNWGFRGRDGGPTRGRTWDHPVMSRGLYQLSYGPVRDGSWLLCPGSRLCQDGRRRSLTWPMAALPARAPSPTATLICRKRPTQSPAAKTPGTLVRCSRSVSMNWPLRARPRV
jgi:hypothetical protein